MATVTVLDADGSEVAELALNLSGDRYTERDVDQTEAKKKALALAADTVASKMRSAFRNAYPSE